MTLMQKQEKIVEYILSKNGREQYEEIMWLVEQVTENIDDVDDCFDYVFEQVHFEED